MELSAAGTTAKTDATDGATGMSTSNANAGTAEVRVF
jgi:hypothetical protein